MDGLCSKTNTNNSKSRRDGENKEIDILGTCLPIDCTSLSKLRILKASIVYLRLKGYLSKKIAAKLMQSLRFDFEDLFLNSGLIGGYIICFSEKGDLIYVSEGVSDYFGFKSTDVLTSYENIREIVSKNDRQIFDKIEANPFLYTQIGSLSFYAHWFLSKIKRQNISIADFKLIKMSGHYDAESKLFIFTCNPIMSAGNRDHMSKPDFSYFSTIQNLNLNLIETSSNAESILGYKRRDNLLLKNLYELISPESLFIVQKNHINISQNKDVKGEVNAIKLIHKEGFTINCLMNMFYDTKGYIVCNYQILSELEINNYNAYIQTLNTDEFLLNSVSSINSFEDPVDDQSTVSSNYDYIQPMSNQSVKRLAGKKRKSTDQLDNIYQENSPSPKFIKNENTNIIQQENQQQYMLFQEFENHDHLNSEQLQPYIEQTFDLSFIDTNLLNLQPESNDVQPIANIDDSCLNYNIDDSFLNDNIDDSCLNDLDNLNLDNLYYSKEEFLQALNSTFDLDHSESNNDQISNEDFLDSNYLNNQFYEFSFKQEQFFNHQMYSYGIEA